MFARYVYPDNQGGLAKGTKYREHASREVFPTFDIGRITR